MDSLSINQFSAPKGEFAEPPQSSKPITASSFKLCPGFIAMVWNNPSQVLTEKAPTTTYKSSSSCTHVCQSQAWHKKHFGGSYFLSPLLRKQNNGMPIMQ